MESCKKNVWKLNNGCHKKRPQSGPNFITGFHHRAYLRTIYKTSKNIITPNRFGSSSPHLPGIPYLTKRKKEIFTVRPTHRRKTAVGASPTKELSEDLIRNQIPTKDFSEELKRNRIPKEQEDLKRKQILKELSEDLKEQQIPKEIPERLLNHSQKNQISKPFVNSQQPEDKGDFKIDTYYKKINLKNNEKNCYSSENVPAQKASNFVVQKLSPQALKNCLNNNLNHSKDFTCNYNQENYKANIPREIVMKKIMNNLSYTEEMLRNGTPFSATKKKLQINYKISNQLRVVEEFSNLGKKIEKPNVYLNAIKPNATSFGPYQHGQLHGQIRSFHSRARDLAAKFNGRNNVTDLSDKCVKGSLIESIKAKIFAKQKEREENRTPKEKLKFPRETEVAMRMMFNSYKTNLAERVPDQVENKIVMVKEKGFPKKNKNVIELVKPSKSCKCLPCPKNLLCQRGAHSGDCKLFRTDEISNTCKDCLLRRLSSVNFTEDEVDLLKIIR